MISVEDFTQAVNYRITGGSTFCWNCFSDDARYLDSDDLESYNSQDQTYSASIIFGKPDFTVFLAEVHDYKNQRSYRLFHPDFREAYLKEAAEKGVDHEQAWDHVKFIDLDVEEDWLEKCRAIVSGIEYDTRVRIQLDFSDDELLKYMLAAHQADITFNQYLERAIKAAIGRHELVTK